MNNTDLNRIEIALTRIVASRDIYNDVIISKDEPILVTVKLLSYIDSSILIKPTESQIVKTNAIFCEHDATLYDTKINEYLHTRGLAVKNTLSKPTITTMDDDEERDAIELYVEVINNSALPVTIDNGIELATLVIKCEELACVSSYHRAPLINDIND